MNYRNKLSSVLKKGLNFVKGKLPERHQHHVTWKNLFVVLLVAMFLNQYIQVSRITGGLSSLDSKGSSLIDEVGRLNELSGALGGDLNEVRSYLRMPMQNYSSIGVYEDDSDSETDPVQLALFEYIGGLSAHEKLSQNLSLRLGLLKGLRLDALKLGQLAEDEAQYSLGVYSADWKLATFVLDKESGVLSLETVYSWEEVEATSGDEFSKYVDEFLEENSDRILKTMKAVSEKNSYIVETFRNATIAHLLETERLDFDSKPLFADFMYTYNLVNEAGEPVAQVVLDATNLEMTLKDLRDTDEVILKVSDLFTALPPFIEKMDVLPSAQRRVIAAKQTLAQTFDDDGFKLLLKEANLVVETEARSDAYRLYYDIKRFDGTLLGSIVIEKATGIVEVVNPDGTPGTVPGSKKKTLDLPSDVPVFSNTPLSSSGAFNILIAGKHGALIDTIIFAHLDEGTSTIDLVSIPRDLYYKGRKINRYADMYGMDEFAKVMSEIVGYKLDKYVMIDMYAFIDVVDLIGGIDIHLEDAVVDPSYKTLDNGVWGTMHYEPGNYHLGGKESLRLARSRHTSSDFARAARQHKILEAIQGKLRNLGVSDATVVYDILKTVLNQTSTNIGLKEAASYYFKYQNFKLNSSNVLSTANVLTVPEYITSEECAALKSTDEMSECDSALQAYTLVPKNENWNLIKWYFQGVFE